MNINNSKFSDTFIPNRGDVSRQYIARVEQFLKENSFIDRFDPPTIQGNAIFCRVKYHPTEISEFVIENELEFNEFIVRYFNTNFEMPYNDWYNMTKGFRKFDNISFLGIIIEFILEQLNFDYGEI